MGRKAQRRVRIVLFSIVAVALVGLFGGLFGAVGMMEYSTHPDFCRSCHLMEPYYESWKASVHGDVACVQCHYPPGTTAEILKLKFQALSQVAKFVTKTYSSKPYAEVQDQSCLRSGCHSREDLDKPVRLEIGGQFLHSIHFSSAAVGQQLACVSCHTQLTSDRHIETDKNACALCHFKGRSEGAKLEPVGTCRGCHDVPKTKFKLGGMVYDHEDYVGKHNVSCRNCHLDVVSGTGAAPRETCARCHNETVKLKIYGQTERIHRDHVTDHKMGCADCHDGLVHGLNGKAHEPAVTTADGLRNGHAPSLRFECGMCHSGTHGGQIEMYSGKAGAIGLPEMPSPMYLAQVDCVGCHGGATVAGGGFKGAVARPELGSCVKCHGEKLKGVWEETEKLLAGTRGVLERKAAAVRAALNALPKDAGKRAPLESRFARIRKWMDFVAESRGEHNIYLAAEAYRRADAGLDTAAGDLGAKVPDASGDPLVSGTFCATACHPTAGVKVPPESVRWRNKTFPHADHLEFGSGCVTCHELGEHKKIPLKRGVLKGVCSTCHEEMGQ